MQEIALFLRQGHSDDSLHRAGEEDGVCGGNNIKIRYVRKKKNIPLSCSYE